MELALSENIKKYRKQNHLTQEQLAEVMGVSTGAVHKWEAAMSVPELDMILKLADFFEISVDVLVGYKVKDNTLNSMVDRIAALAKVKDTEALTEMEKALKKYPNSFWLVHYCASLYSFFGVGNKNTAVSQRALELYGQALMLIKQNDDPGISEDTVRGEMAYVYYTMGEYEKALDILKNNNPSGMYSDFIGTVLAIELNKPKEAEPYMLQSLINSAAKLMTSLMSYAFILSKRKEYKKAAELLETGLDMIRSFHMGKEIDIAYKLSAVYYVLLAYTRLHTGKKEEAGALLKKAAAMSVRFDESPDYGIRDFIVDLSDKVIVYDLLLGSTARESIDAMVKHIGDRELNRMWKQTCS